MLAYLFVLLASSPVCGQLFIHGYCKEKTESLIKSGVDTVIFYQPWLSPLTNEANDCCIIYDRGYLFWTSGNKLTILKYYKCISLLSDDKYPVVQTIIQNDSLHIFEFLKTNFDSIRCAHLQPALLKKKEDGKELVQDFSQLPVYDDAFTMIAVFTKKESFENGYMDNDLNDGIIRKVGGTIREIWESVHYQSNIDKPIYKMISKIELLINGLEKTKQIH